MDRNSQKMQDLMKLADNGGNDAMLILLDKLHSLEDKLEEISKEPPEDQKVEKIAMRLAAKLSIMEPPKDGKDYVLTSADKEEIASKIKVPVVEKVIEKTEVIKEVPIVTNKIVKEVSTDVATIAYLEDEIKKLEEKILSVSSKQRVGWGAHPLVIQNASGTVIEKVARNIKFAGSAVASVLRGADGVVTVTLNSGAGGTLNSEVPVGTVNDTNKTFTVSNTPAYIVVNGLAYQAGEGIFTSYSAPTITLNTPVGTGGFIRSYY